MNPGRWGRHPEESMNSFGELDGRLLVVFDGHCGLCNRAVRWLVRRDSGDRVRFAAFESEKVAEMLVRSDAVVALLGELPRPWGWVAVGLGWIPRALRDVGYRLVARWRYRIWGRLESCPIPTPEERKRFL